MDAMNPSPAEIKVGEHAYRVVDWYERKRRQARWATIMGNGVMVCILVVGFFVENRNPQGRLFLPVLFMLPMFGVINWIFFWINLQAYPANKLIVRLLEEKYGSALPWVAEREVMASAQKLESAIRRLGSDSSDEPPEL